MSESLLHVDPDDRVARFAHLVECVDAILALDVVSEDSEGLRRSLVEIESQVSRLRYSQVVRTSELATRQVPGELGFRGVWQFLHENLRCTHIAAKQMALAATRFGPRRALTGESLEPLLPLAADALAGGAISVKHAEVIAEAVLGLPDDVRTDYGERVETTLVAHARDADPGTVGLLAQRVIAHLDPDGPVPVETDRRSRSRRAVHLSRLGDSSGTLSGTLSPSCQAIWETVLTPLAAKPVKDELGEDIRTQAQRMHDAFEQAGRLLLENTKLPASSGAATTLVVTMTLAQLEARAGAATTHHGGMLSIAEALRIAAEGKVLPVVLSDAGGVLSFGRERRLAHPVQRKALFARDRGCSFPGCVKPAARSEIHHATDWAKGGHTDVGAMTVTCGYHNNEAPRQGWTTVMIKGIPHWKPPKWKDRDQKPIRNYMHHPELLVANLQCDERSSDELSCDERSCDERSCDERSRDERSRDERSCDNTAEP